QSHSSWPFVFFFQAEDGIRDFHVTGVQTCALPIWLDGAAADRRVYPAIDLGRSSTRNEALLTSEAEARIMNRIRRSHTNGASLEIGRASCRERGEGAGGA